MSTTTTNYNFVKPALTDAPPDITVLNQNFDSIDSLIHGIENGYLSENVQIYVRTNGNDSTGKGTSALPYKTINKALSTLPKNLNGHTARINTGAGTFDENVVAENFYGGILYIGLIPNNTVIRSLTVSNCEYVVSEVTQISGNGVQNTTLLNVTNGSTLEHATTLTLAGVSKTSVGVSATKASNVIFQNTVTANNCKGIAIAESKSNIVFTSVIGSGNLNGLYAKSGSSINYASMTATTTSTALIATGDSNIN